MDTKKLRQKILDLAIRGKLVPQDPNDEPAFELLKRINPEFEACDNTPRIYSIPNSWCWTTLGCVCDIVTGSTPSKTQLEYYGGEFPFYKPSDLDAGRHVTIPSEYLSEAGKKVSRIIPKDSTAICCIGSIGKCGYIEKEGTTNQQINTAVPSKGLNPLYLYYFCNSTFFGDNLSADSSAITISIVNKSKLGKMHMPVPPIAEQKRIVAAIEQWFSLIDILENEKSDLQASIQQAKSKILDLAIHGKLVPQDPNDEPAIELLKRINPKFEACDNELDTTQLPDSWCWTTLGSLFNHNTGKALNKSDLQEGSLLPYITTSNVYWNCFNLSEIKKMFFKDSEIDKCTVTKGDLLVCEGGDIGRSAIWGYDYDICIQNHIHRLRAKGDVSHLLYLYVLMFYKWTDKIRGKGIGLQGLSSGLLDKMVVPLPPYQEQLRIVAKIEELFSVLDSIKESLA